MRRLAMGFLLTGLGLSALAGPVLAHHAFAGQYDKDNPIQLTGIVTKIEWMNPIARFDLDVIDASGTVTNWNIELGPPLILRRAGWTQNSLKAGDQVTVAGYRAKDGSKMANGTKVTLPDGRQVFAGSTTGTSTGHARRDGSVRVAIVGVGNCASSLVQGVHD